MYTFVSHLKVMTLEVAVVQFIACTVKPFVCPRNW